MKIIAIGRNYAAHIAELNNERPSEPVIFMNPANIVRQKLEYTLHIECRKEMQA